MMLFDGGIGDNAIRMVASWYCDSGILMVVS